jgi:hypothetical protein
MMKAAQLVVSDYLAYLRQVRFLQQTTPPAIKYCCAWSKVNYRYLKRKSKRNQELFKRTKTNGDLGINFAFFFSK